MDRRQFLGLASFAGLSVASLDALARPGSRGGLLPLAETYRGPLFLTINARGGWDPTLLCDPKGSAGGADVDAVNDSFLTRDIAATASGIRHAPLADFRRFFEKHDRRLLVINGVQVGTRGHADGARHTWSGRLADDTPSFAALVTAVHGGARETGYLSFGGYDETAGMVARLRGADSRAPARAENFDRVADDAVRFDQLGTVYAARTGADELRALQRRLPALDEGPNPLIRQIQVALAAYRAGVTVAVNLELDGFDTHVDHDAEHVPLLARLLAALDFAGEEAERQGVADELVIVVGSEFGRTPEYNALRGKDHWPVTSVLAMGKGITGGRVVGATSERCEALRVEPGSLAVGDRGVHIEPKHVHQELRRLAGITEACEALYPLEVADGEDLSLFGRGGSSHSERVS
ncbi:DUF1501 domain-containing protein [Nannocystis punicea]|uniref:DUF1501 domain-containing protein n=1 Tax=Nannocystis punicea TaxID=2995304 RepID=A0ABY7H8R4_9BACT|nr:DUF1501 domain-containing protein [Nannocystis poenicansa]WAS95647.1 DUF1501 domain-containing protein [Nannocystis poenicansa]